MSKVAYFIAEYQTFTGSQKSLLHTIRAWQQEGGEALVILPGEGRCAQIFRENRIPTIVCDAPPSLHIFQRRLLGLPVWRKFFIWLKEVLPYSWQVWKILKKEKCLLLHCNSTRSILMSAWFLCSFNIPRLLHVRGKQVEKGLLWKMAQTLANKIILVAKHLTTEVNPKHHHKMRLLYNAIETSEIEALSQVKIDLSVLPKDNPLVVSLASLLPRKGIHHLVRAAAILSNSLEATFVVAGGEVDKTYSNFVRKLIHDLCPDHFFILPWLPNPYPLLQRAVVAALATVDKPEQVPTDNPDAMPVGEGLPRFILEAMALKKPVVATRVDGCDEAIVDGETGFLVTPANPEAMAEAIRRLLRNPELAKEMGERARQRVEENFSMEKHQKVLAEIYGELLRGG